MAQIDFKNARVYMRDGTTPTPNSIEITIGEGNLTYSETKNRQYTLDRGALDEVRNGDEAPVDVSFDGTWEYITGSSASGGTPTPEDVVKKRGNAAAWVSTDADACRPFAIDIVIEYIPDCAGQDKETITLPDFRYESIDHDIRAGTLSFSGKCNVTEATVLREVIS